MTFKILAMAAAEAEAGPGIPAAAGKQGHALASAEALFCALAWHREERNQDQDPDQEP